MSEYQHIEIDHDLYGRGFDGVHGVDAEKITKIQALHSLKAFQDYRAKVLKGEVIDYDLYGRGDPRIFGRNSDQINLKQAKHTLNSRGGEKASRRAVVFPVALMMKLRGAK